MKYYIGEIDTYIGESTFCNTIRFKTDDKPQDYLDKVASTFWGEESERDFDTGLYEFGDRMAGCGRWQEVDASTYNALHILVELNHGVEA